MTEQRNAIVLGAGPGGLACAHELVALGWAVTVLEKEAHVGGLCQTVERDGFRFDLGGHRWFTKNADLHAWFLRLMEGELVTVERTSRIFFDGRYFDYPVNVGNVLRTAGLWTTLRCLTGYARSVSANALGRNEQQSMECAFVAQFGRPLYEMFFQGYSEKVWGRPCTEMSADWVTQRTRGLSIWATGIEAFLQGWSKARSLIDRFVYPRLGYQRICERLREEVEAGGSEVKLGALVRRVDHSDPERVVVRYEQGGESRELVADRVVSTIPLTGLLVHGLEPGPPEEVIAAANSLEFRSVICVNLMLDKPRMTSDTWIYCHDEGIGFARLHEPRNWSPDMAPEGRTSVVLEFFCHRGDEVHQKTDEELVQWGIDDLVRLGLVAREEVLGGFAVRADEAYPVYALGYREALEKMHAHVHGIERVSLVGRGGIFRYNNSDHSIEMGLVMARLIDGGGDESAVLRVNSSPEYSEKDLIRPRPR